MDAERRKSRKVSGKECWTLPRGNVMQGSGRLIQGKKTVSREFMTIEADSDGQIKMYVGLFGEAMKTVQSPVAFEFRKVSETEFAFENPKHDYPQRIVYKRQEDRSLIVIISKMDGSKSKEFRFK